MKARTKRRTHTTPKDVSDAFLDPIAEAAANDRGSKQALRRALSERTGEEVPRERVERWLHIDRSKRQQPLLGSGLLLAEEAAKLFGDALTKATKTKGKKR